VKDHERSDGLRPAAAGLEGSDAHPAPPGEADTHVIAPTRDVHQSVRQRAMCVEAIPVGRNRVSGFGS